MAIQVGQKFKLEQNFGFNKKEVYILASVDKGNKVTLIDTKDGRRWKDPVKVRDMRAITAKEWEKIAKTTAGEWVPID